MIILRQVVQKIPVLMLLLSTGCSFLSGGAGFVRPEVQLADLRITEATLLETGLEVDVRIDNDNPEELLVKAGSHRLYLNDVYLGKGFLVEPTTVPPYGTAIGEVKLFVSNATFLSKLLPILESNALDYRIDSALVVNRGHFDRRVKLRNEDTFKFRAPLDTSKLKPFL